MQRDILKNIIGKSNGILKNVHINHRKTRKRKEKMKNNRKQKYKMAKINSNRSIILNVNYINISSKRQRLADQLKKHDPTISCLRETPFNYDVQAG